MNIPCNEKVDQAMSEVYPMLQALRMPLVKAVFMTAILSVVACERVDKLILQREWTANAEFAGDVWASKVAAARSLIIEVREGSEVIDPIKMVRSGEASFGVASADRILQENEGGAELVIIAAATFKSPVIFLTSPASNINEPRDFVGHTIGLQAGTNTQLVFDALAKAQDLPSSEMKIVDSGWGTQMFETNSVDVLGAFAYDEPVRLRLKNVAMGKPIVPAEYGVRYVGTVYFTRKAFVTAKPEIVQRFVDALVEGWKMALAQPTEAMNMLGEKFEAVRNDMSKERESFNVGREYFAGEQGYILYASKERWIDMAKSLQDLGKIKSFDFDANVDYRFLAKATGR
jgi:NitT/TauT family transport system substrate-binding protein